MKRVHRFLQNQTPLTPSELPLIMETLNRYMVRVLEHLYPSLKFNILFSMLGEDEDIYEDHDSMLYEYYYINNEFLIPIIHHPPWSLILS